MLGARKDGSVLRVVLTSSARKGLVPSIVRMFVEVARMASLLLVSLAVRGLSRIGGLSLLPGTTTFKGIVACARSLFSFHLMRQGACR